MALILPVKDVFPKISSDCYLAPNATIVGDVMIGEHCSIWFNAVVRGDVNSIRIGHHTNIQDGVIVHGTYQSASTDIGDYVNVGHRAIVHGCKIENHVLIGMGAILMDHVHVDSHVIIAAGAVVLENTHCESGFLYAGVPARKIKALSPEQFELLERLPHNYVLYASWFHEI